MGAIDAAALGHGREKEVFSILVVISVVGTISGKSLKLLLPDVKVKMHQFDFGSRRQTPLRELTALP